MNKTVVLALIGGIATALTQRFTPTGWWLNSGRGVAVTSVVLALLGVAVGATAARPLPPRGLLPPIGLWVGANIGLAVVLFTVGPGNLFPIALVFGAGISVFAVGAGSLIGMLARTLWKPAPSTSRRGP